MKTLLVACAAATMLLVSSARAAPSDTAAREARRHFQTAEARFKAGAFAEALAEYQAGYDAKPLPGFLINIAQCQRRLGDLKTARATYLKFVMVAPDSPLVPQAKAMVEELDKLLAQLGGAETKKPDVKDARRDDAGKDDAKPEKDAEVAPVAAENNQNNPAAVAETPAAPPAVPAAAAEADAGKADSLLVASPGPASEPPAPSRTRWWLWGALGAVVVGGAVTAVVLSTGGTTTTIHDGSLGTLRR
jgi:hypothetical protein